MTDRATGQPVSGATVKVGTATATTNAQGAFTLSGLAAGSVSIEVSATGFQTKVLSGTLGQGANDAGTIALDRLATSAKVSGKVSDVATNLPIGGATVRVTLANATLTGTTNGSGLYEIAGVTQAQYTVMASAAGYQAKSVAVTLPTLGDATVNIALDKVATGGLTLRRVATNLPSYAPFSSVEIEVEVENTTALPTEVRFAATVSDAQGNAILEVPGLPATVPPNTLSEIELETHLGFQPAGNYSVAVRGYDLNGVLRVEGTTSFAIAAVTRIGANVGIDPPIAQFGTGQPINLTASLYNSGNQDLPAGTVELTVKLENPDLNVAPQATATASLVVSGAPATSLIGGAFDPAGNLFLLNSTGTILKIAPSGSLIVLGTVANPNTTTNSLIADGVGFLYVLNTSHQIVKVNADTGALITPAINPVLTSALAFARDASGRFYIAGTDSAQVGTQLFRVNADGSGKQALIGPGFWSPMGIARAADGTLYVANYFGNSISKVDTAGRVIPFVEPSAGISRPRGLTIGADGYIYVAAETAGRVERISPAGVKDAAPYASGFTTPRDLRFDSSGNLFVANATSISKVLPNRTVQPFARTIASDPQGMAYDTSGNLYFVHGSASSRSVTRLDGNDGTTDLLTTGLVGTKAVTVSAGGDLYVSTALNTVVQRTSGGIVAPGYVTGLTTPRGLALGGDGRLYIAEEDADRVSVVNSAPTATPFVESHVTAAIDIRFAANGDRYVLNQGWLSKLPASGAPSVVTRWTFTAASLALDPVSGFYVHDGSTVRKLSATGTVLWTRSIPAVLAAGVVLGPAGQVLVAETASGNVREIDTAGNLLPTPYIAMGAAVKAIVSDTSGGFYVLMNSTAIRYVSPAKANAPVTTIADARRIALDKVGNELYVATGTGVVAYHLGTSALRTVFARTNLGPIEFGGGTVLAVDTVTMELFTYSPQGTKLDTLAGFTKPTGIAWNGAELLIAANRVVAVAPGGQPRILVKDAIGSYPVVSGGYLYGTGAGTGNVVRYSLDASLTPDTRVQEVHYTLLGSSSLTGLALRGDGAIAVASPSDNRIEVFNPATKALIAGYAGILDATAIAVDSAGQVYVSSSSQSVFQKTLRFDPTGKRSTVFSTARAAALSIDGGQLYAAEQLGEIYRYDANGGKAFVARTSDPGAV
ncbi:MAG: carboxypeptidase regulatory-like domain-containing protein, partial [Candidatus Binatia bacterium]